MNCAVRVVAAVAVASVVTNFISHVIFGYLVGLLAFIGFAYLMFYVLSTMAYLIMILLGG